jgi:group I intron endonuclease
MVIYKITNLINGMIYVGQDTKNDPNYFGSGILIVRAIKKHGKENFKKEVIDVVESLEVLNEKEMYWVKFCNCKAPNGYNLTDGGHGVIGYVWTEEDKKKVSGESNPSKRLDVRKKMSETHRGKLMPEGTGEKISRARKGKKRLDMVGENNPAKRLEVRKKISEARSGKLKSEQHKKKISEAMRKNYSMREHVRK